jgi:hypothetical protein
MVAGSTSETEIIESHRFSFLGNARPTVSRDGGLRRRLQPAIPTCDGDEYSGFISASGSVADMGGLANGSNRSQMTHFGQKRLTKVLGRVVAVD